MLIISHRKCYFCSLIFSAGIGRTGVFLAIDTILDKLEKGIINCVNVFGEVCAMRERRMNMVQTLVCMIIFHLSFQFTILIYIFRNKA